MRLRNAYDEEVKKAQNKIGGDSKAFEDRKFKLLRGDGFLNIELRSLTVSAFLRCLIGGIEFSPSFEKR